MALLLSWRMWFGHKLELKGTHSAGLPTLILPKLKFLMGTLRKKRRLCGYLYLMGGSKGLFSWSFAIDCNETLG